MDNDAFRQLLKSGGATSSSNARTTDRGPAPSAMALGSRKQAFGAMTPRNVRSSHLTSVFDKAAASKGDASFQKKKSAAQRGLNLGKGYQDRALERRLAADAEESNDAVEDRMRQMGDLEEELREKKITREEFEHRKQMIVEGRGDGRLKAKGLDMALLDEAQSDGETGGRKDHDEEFDEMEQKEVQRLDKDKHEKRGEYSNVAPVIGQKRTRDDILKGLKAKREADAASRAAARPDLGDRFRSIEARADKPRVTIDSKGREVILTRDESGRIKKKIRKVVQSPNGATAQSEAPIKYLDADAALPPPPKATDEAESDSAPEAMFDDAGTDYDPLAGLSGDDDSDQDEARVDDASTKTEQSQQSPTSGDSEGQAAPPDEDPLIVHRKARNYFATNGAESEAKTLDTAADKANPFKDPAFLSAISRASDLAKFKMSLGPTTESGDTSLPAADTAAADDLEEDSDTRIERLEKEPRLRKKREDMLRASTRDLDDIDMGFGGGGGAGFDGDDDDDGADGRLKLSEWKGTGAAADDDHDLDGQKGGAKAKKKRNRGKRKGDKNDAKDVLEVLKRRANG